MKKWTNYFRLHPKLFPSWRGRVEEETPKQSKGNQKESKGNLSSIQVIRKICHFLRNDFNLKAISNDTVLENKLFVNFASFIFIFLFSFFFFHPRSVHAQKISYPIAELGNCANERECYYYCQIPSHTPACWSYGKYILAPSVLGDTAVNITYPVPELGNCSSEQDCFIYCQQPQNQAACYRFGKDKGLIKEEKEEEPLKEVIMEAAKGELGCDGKEACIAFCHQEENREKCALFAQKYGLRQGPPSGVGHIPDEIMEKAQTEFDCNSHESCSRFCSQKENQERCYQFAQENDLLKEKKDDKVNKKETIEAAKNEFGCDSKEACRAFCEKEENREKCVSFARKYNLANIQLQNTGFPKKGFRDVMLQNQQTPSFSGPGGCASEEECKAYCEKHPTECLGFGIKMSKDEVVGEKSEIMMMEGKTNREGDFLGPGGCKTEKECQAYCEKHPGVCPGFPAPQQQPGQLFLQQSPPPYPSQPQFQPQQPQSPFQPPPQFNQPTSLPGNEPG